jgi:hypothetical protein
LQCEEKLRSKADSGSPVAWVFDKVRVQECATTAVFPWQLCMLNPGKDAHG